MKLKVLGYVNETFGFFLNELYLLSVKLLEHDLRLELLICFAEICSSLPRMVQHDDGLEENGDDADGGDETDRDHDGRHIAAKVLHDSSLVGAVHRPFHHQLSVGQVRIGNGGAERLVQVKATLEPARADILLHAQGKESSGGERVRMMPLCVAFSSERGNPLLHLSLLSPSSHKRSQPTGEVQKIGFGMVFVPTMARMNARDVWERLSPQKAYGFKRHISQNACRRMWWLDSIWRIIVSTCTCVWGGAQRWTRANEVLVSFASSHNKGCALRTKPTTNSKQSSRNIPARSMAEDELAVP